MYLYVLVGQVQEAETAPGSFNEVDRAYQHQLSTYLQSRRLTNLVGEAYLDC